MFNEGDKVILSDNIFPGSDDPTDVAMRGRKGFVSMRMWEHMNGGDWGGCYEIQFLDGDFCYVTENEIQLDNDASDSQDTVQDTIDKL